MSHKYFFDKENSKDGMSPDDMSKISRLLMSLSKAHAQENIQLKFDCLIGKNVELGNTYIYCENLGITVFINDEINKITWLYTDTENGNEHFFNTYSQAKKFIDEI